VSVGTKVKLVLRRPHSGDSRLPAKLLIVSVRINQEVGTVKATE
jgi:hypothetical protein